MIGDRERYQAAKAAFVEARELPATERCHFLERLGRDDPDLGREVGRLLAADHPGAPLSPPTDTRGSFTPTAHDAAARVPETIGPYRILGVLGVGGMGVVYRAEQPNPRRAVALKVIRPGLLSEKAAQRFEHEVALLARLAHPGIAQILEAGRHDAAGVAQAYFAMELVEGQPITRYADDAKLATRERVALVIQVCEAVAHAHQKGVIHRDLKPANILVGGAATGSHVGRSSEPPTQSVSPPRPGAGARPVQPKILDFGVARAIDSEQRLTTVDSGVGVLIGTLPYMSPEQAWGDPALVDTRADVYSIGVLAFELLTGRLPHDLEGKPLPEALRVIRETSPRRLSSVDRTLRGDLDTVVGKALESDPSRRYGSAAELAGDLQRYLRSEPIAARAPSMIYQVRKLVARHRAASGLAALLFLSIVAIALVATVQAVRVARQRDDAIAARKHADEMRLAAQSAQQREAEQRRNAEAAREAAQTAQRREATERRAAERVVEFLEALFESGNPSRVANSTPHQLLDSAARRLELDASEARLLRARVMDTIGSLYRAIGDRPAARHWFQRALAIREANQPDDDVAIANNLLNLASVSERPHLLPLARRGWARYQDRIGRESGLIPFEALYATCLYQAGEHQEALEHAQKAADMARARTGPWHHQTARWVAHLAGIQSDLGRLEQSIASWDEAVAILRRWGDNWKLAESLAARARVQHRLQRFDDAARSAREAVRILERGLGADDPQAQELREGLDDLLRNGATTKPSRVARD